MKKSSRYRTARAVLQNFRRLRVTARHVDTFFFIEPFLGISHDKRHVGWSNTINSALRSNIIVDFYLFFFFQEVGCKLASWYFISFFVLYTKII